LNRPCLKTGVSVKSYDNIPAKKSPETWSEKRGSNPLK